MRLSAQNNQFIFNLPTDFIPVRLEEKYKLLFEKNLIPYDSVIDYINSTIKEITSPSLQFDTSEQTLKRGKNIKWKDAKNVMDAFTHEIDMTFRAVDSYFNYNMLQEIIIDFQMDNSKPYIPFILVHMLDKDGDIMYTTQYDEVLVKSLSEVRYSYNITDFSEKTFTITF